MTVSEFLADFVGRRPPTVAEISRATGLSSYQVHQRVLVLRAGKARKLVWADGCTAWSHTVRHCLACGKLFPSEGPHNRLCGKCRALDVGPEPCKVHGVI